MFNERPYVGGLMDLPINTGPGRAELVAATLADRIARGGLAAGTPLKEVELAASLGVSRNTLREAIKRLAERGLVRLAHHRTAVVASLSRTGIVDLYRVRRLLELGAIDATRGAPPETYHEVGAALERLAGAVGTGGIIDADLGFHRAIIRLHRSPRIEQAFAGCLDELRLGLVYLEGHSMSLAGLVDEHRAVYRFLTQGHHDECRALLADHLDASERHVLSATGVRSNPNDGRRPGV